MLASPDFLSVLCGSEAQAFWHENKEIGPEKLLNLAQKKFGKNAALVLQQHALRAKARQKFPEMVGINWLFTPQSFEQASSAATALFKASLMQGELLVDLTAGAGIDAFYARPNFNKLILVEKQAERAALLRWNFKNFEAVEVVEADTYTYLEKLPTNACIYLDPDRRPDGKRVFQLAACVPDLGLLLPELQKKQAQIWIKTSPMLDIQAGWQFFGYKASVYVLAVENEVKELLWLVGTENSRCTAVNLAADGTVLHRYSSNLPVERLPVPIRLAETGDWFIEPQLALIKSRQAAHVAAAMGWSALNNEADYYVSQTPPEQHLGRVFVIEAVLPYKIKLIKAYCNDKAITKANIAKRAFYDEVSDIRKKTGLKDGGEHYFFFTKNKNDAPLVYITRRSEEI